MTIRKTAGPEAPADMNELVDADIPRVDLVGKAANGHKFIIAKGAEGEGGLMSKDFVAGLVAKAKKDLDVTEALSDQGGAEALQPGSSDWEATDAATAQKWIGILHRAKYAAELLASREATEYALNGDWDDSENEWDLQDVAWCLDSAIATLAAYAAGEAGEVALAEDGVVKSVLDLDPMAIAQVELLVPLVKAGRVLSTANEADLRDAAAKIEKVLAQLPAAPEAPVEKAEAPEGAAAPADAAEAPSAAPEQAPVEKADGEEEKLVAVFNQDGKLIGAVKADAITELTTGGSDSGEDEGAGEGDGEQGTDAAAAPADGGDAATIPGTDTVQSPPVDDGDKTVTKGAVSELLKSVLTPFAEAVAQEVQKSATAQSELQEQVSALTSLVKALGYEPDDRHSPTLNGATGQAGLAQRTSRAHEFEAEDAALAKSIEQAKTPEERMHAQATAAYAKLARNFQRPQ
jgi:hypothetical protein